jgi:hypothetical protein
MSDVYEHVMPNGITVYVDDCDAWLLQSYTPYYSGYGIVGADYYIGILFPNGKRFKLSRIIMQCWYEEVFVDHKDRNTLNNCRSNLRLATRAQNNANRQAWGLYPKGITYDPWKQLYRARIQVDGKRISLGRHKRLEDACAAYNEAA